MNNVLNNNKAMEALLKAEATMAVMERNLATQERLVKSFIGKINTNVAVFPRVNITSEDITIELLAGGNTPITNHESINYINRRQELEFTITDDFGNEKKVSTKVGPTTNYRYTKSLIKVDVSDAVASDLDSIKAEYVLVKYNNLDKPVDAKIVINGRVDGVLVSEYLEEGYIRYAVNSWSNSDERNGGILLYNAEELSASEAYDRMDSIFGGALSARLRTHGYKPTMKKLAKDVTRNGIFNAPMLHAFNFGKDAEFGILVVEDKLEGVTDYTDVQDKEMKEMGIHVDNFTFDGMAVQNAKLTQAIAKFMLGIELTEEEACMISFQSRANVLVSKTYSATEDNAVFARMCDNIKANYNTFAIGDENNLCLILDANAYKLMTKENATSAELIKLYILDIARYSISKTSGQLIDKFMAKDPVATIKALKRLTSENIDMYAVDKFDGNKDLVFDLRDNGSLAVQGDVVNNMIKVNTERVYSDRYAMEKVISGTIKLQEAAVKKIKLPIESLFLRALFDYSKLIQSDVEYILGYDEDNHSLEAYNLDILIAKEEIIAEIMDEYRAELEAGVEVSVAIKSRKAKLDEVLTSVVIKYPCPGSEEFQLVRFLTLEEIAERVELEIKEDADKELVYKYFSTKGSGCILLSPSNIVKNKLAGMDTDYDAVACIFEKELVDIVRNTDEGVAAFIDTDANVPQYKANERAKKMLDKLAFRNM